MDFEPDCFWSNKKRIEEYDNYLSLDPQGRRLDTEVCIS